MSKPKRGKASAKSREELRRENRQELERQKRLRQTIAVIVIVAVVAAAAAILSLTVFFKISAVEVDASLSQYSAAQIRDASGIAEGENLFLTDLEAAGEQIGRQLPYTGEIIIKRSFPSKVKIYVEDSTIKAAVKYNDEYIVLNESNKVLAKAGSIDTLNSLVETQEKKKKARTSGKKTTEKTTKKASSEEETTTTTTTATTTAVSGETTVPSVEIAGGEDLRNASDKVAIILGVKVKEARVGYPLKAKNAEVFKTYQEIRTAMDRWGVKDITSADLTKVSDIKLTYQQRITILLGSATNLDRKAAMCARVLEEQDKVSTEQKGTIDLSIEGKAYFSEGGATTRTTTTTTTVVVTDVDGQPITMPDQSTTGAGSTTTVTGSGSATTTAGTTAADPSATTAPTGPDPADTGG